MIYSDLNDLQRDSKQQGLYDMFTTTFINNTAIEVFGHVVTKEEEMRPDLICNTIYKRIDFVSFLCDLNNVKNPLSVKTGDIWLYVNEKEVALFKPNSETKDNIRQELINKNKGAKKDPNRSDKSIPDQLPPTIKKNTTPNITIDDAKSEVILGNFSASERPKPKKGN